MNASRCERSSASAPGAKAVSGVLSVSTSLLNTHRWPDARRRSSPRFSRSSCACRADSARAELTAKGRSRRSWGDEVYNRRRRHRMQIAHRRPDGSPKYTNHLVTATSPYLRMHAHNPVNWYPWGSEALEQARVQGKPIHLSVGYLACHWCHVLEQESFEDEDTAQVLNENFINIKVDREERPDIDRIYQVAQQMITQRGGGWPLTMFLAHDDQRPFFGGTYFPKEPRFGLPAFKDLLLRVVQFYREHPQEMRTQNEALVKAFDLMNASPAAADAQLSDAPLRAARTQFARLFDDKNGGFGGAPKFPQPQILTRLLRDWRATTSAPEPDLRALYMATLTLRRMADGGINDQLGGGFCRYAVDELWMIPHFEKMLYDNGELLAAYAQAALASGEADYARVAAETAA